MDYSMLLSPMKIGNLEIKNRTLLRGFSNSSNEGMRPKAPSAVKVSIAASSTKGVRAAYHSHFT